mgnify:CR=1 FL=1
MSTNQDKTKFISLFEIEKQKSLLQNVDNSFPSPQGEGAGGEVVSFELPELANLELVVCKIIAEAGVFSDGEQKYLPVLPDKVLVTESMPMIIRGGQTRTFNFRSLTDSIDTSSPMGRFFFHVMGALAEMERELIVERTRAGLAAARAEGRVGGRRPKLTPEQWAQAGRLLAAGETRQRVALIYDVGISTLYKRFPASDI